MYLMGSLVAIFILVQVIEMVAGNKLKILVSAVFDDKHEAVSSTKTSRVSKCNDECIRSVTRY